MRMLVRLAGLLLFVTLAVTFVDRLVPDPPLVGRLVAVPADPVGAVDTAGLAGGDPVRIGEVEVAWIGEDARTWYLEARPVNDPDRIAFATVPGTAFVSAAGTRTQIEVTQGHVTFDEQVLRRLPDQTVDRVHRGEGQLEVSGRLLGDGTEPAVTYRLVLAAAGDGRLALSVDLDDPGQTAMHDTDPGTDPATIPLDRTLVTLAADPDAAVLGLGAQFTHLDLRGRRVPIVTREQGVGRGAQPLTFGADLTAGAGGDWTWTYSAVPLAVTTSGTAVLAEDTEVARVDLTVPERTTIEVWRGDGALLQLIDGPDPATLLARTTAVTGRMRSLPDWVHDGLILGMQGGTEVVRERLAQVRGAGVPVTAVWLQDWVGQRTTSFGDRLWWSWTLDEQRYPGWNELVAELAADDIEVLTYTNPFVAVDAPPGTGRRDLIGEVRDAGYLVTRPDGQPYAQDQGEFDAVLIDLTNPAAWDWYLDVLVDEVAGVGASGWMADFGESLPFDAVLHDGDPHELHNAWPVLWAELNRQALEAAGLGEDGVAFHRAGALRSPEHATLFWLGDQMVDWSDEDGIGSAVTGLLSAGLSGWTLNHSDTGGYTAVVTPIARWVRSEELLARWFELNAFGPVLRTHEGNRPADNHQVDDDPASLAHAAAMTRVFVALAPERRRLVDQAAATGLPVVRQGWLVVPDDPRAPGWDRQLFLGEDLLHAPVTRPGVDRVRIDVPEGRWVDPWTGQVVEGGHDVRVRHPAPLGRPAVLVREGSAVAELLGPELLDPEVVDPEALDRAARP